MSHDVISNNWDEIVAYYDKTLNLDKSLFKTTNDEPTPIACVVEMLEKMPEYRFADPDAKWLDPCCGNGNFHLVIYFRLLKYHTPHHILTNMLFFNDTNGDRLDIVRRVFRADVFQLNITQHDFLSQEYLSRFTYVVANPPYAKLMADGRRASKNHNLIGAFLAKALNVLAPGGVLLFITPDNWMSLADRNTIVGEITSKQIIHLDIHSAKKYFKKVGSSFTWYLVENTPSHRPFTVSGVWHKSTPYTSLITRTTVRDFIPLYFTDAVDSIFSKTVMNDSHMRFRVETSSDLHRYTKRNLIVDVEDADHPYPLVHTPSTTVFASRPHKYQDGFKVFISTTSYYSTRVECGVGMTQSIAFIRCDCENTALATKSVLDHPLYVFLNNVCRWGNFNNVRILQRFPYCDSHSDVYAKFGITDDEKCVIENGL